MLKRILSCLKCDKINADEVRFIVEINSSNFHELLELSNIFSNAFIFASNVDLESEKNSTDKTIGVNRIIKIESNFFNYRNKYDNQSNVSSNFHTIIEKHINAIGLTNCKTDDLGILRINSEFLENFNTKDLNLFLKEFDYIQINNLNNEKNLNLMKDGIFEKITPNIPDFSSTEIYRHFKRRNIKKPYKVIEQNWGGLGDNLQLSTIPEELFKKGISTYLSSKNFCRNHEVFDLIWASNPYIKGLIDENGTIGDETINQNIGQQNLELPFISRIEACHGIKTINEYPKVYLEPEILSSLEGAILIDLSSTSISLNQEIKIEYINHTILNYHYNSKKIKQIKFDNFTANNELFFNGIEIIHCNSIQQYWNILNSIEILVTVHSGAQSLAAAAFGNCSKLKKVHCLANTHQFNTRMYIYDDFEYFIK
jgi:hypothetical protein